MGSIQSDFSLDCRPTLTIASKEYIPATIGAFISQVSMISNVSERLLKLDSYGKRLEDEIRKIDAFKRELPLCMLLLSDAINTVKMESVKYKKQNTEPILKEFIPLNKDYEEAESEKIELKNRNMDNKDKMNWMSSVQLWNHNPYSSELDSNPKEILNSNAKKIISEDKNGACVPFKGGYSLPRSEIDDAEVRLLSLDNIGIKRTREEDVFCGGMDSKLNNHTLSSSCSMPRLQSSLGTVSQVQASTTRKRRRSWSSQLHHHFVEALHQLGGCQVATPKQIRELMKVDGLTNDEVKSHLQKFRLHTQKLPDESTNQRKLQYNSPQSPIQLCGGTSMTLDNSLEDEDDEKSESHSWKSHVLDK